MVVGSSVLPLPPSSPQCLFGFSSPAAASRDKQAPLLPPHLPTLPSTPVSARCLLSVRLQSSPGDRRTMLKAFSQF